MSSRRTLLQSWQARVIIPAKRQQGNCEWAFVRLTSIYGLSLSKSLGCELCIADCMILQLHRVNHPAHDANASKRNRTNWHDQQCLCYLISLGVWCQLEYKELFWWIFFTCQNGRSFFLVLFNKGDSAPSLTLTYGQPESFPKCLVITPCRACHCPK